MAAWSGWAPHQKGIVLDGFAGPGGWSEGIRRWLGLHDVGLEWDEAATQTRAAAGHLTIRVDISSFVLEPLIGKVWGSIQSPPCTKFSMSGNGLGRKFIEVLADGIRRMMRGEDCRQEMRDLIYPAALAARQEDNKARKQQTRWSEEKVQAAAMEDTVATVLVLEPARFLYALICQRADGQGIPLEWTAFEQVPSVLPLWKVYAQELRRLGWSVWAGVLNAANYGVPQTRERAVLIGSSVRKVAPPEPTHAKVSQPDLFGPGLPKWVSMAEALGLDGREVVNTRGERKTPGGNEFPTDRPSNALTGKVRSWTLHTNRAQRPDGTRQTTDPHSAPAPAPALTSKSGGQWVLKHNARANATVRSVDEPAATLAFGHARNEYEWMLRNGTQQNAAVRDLDQPAGTLFFGGRCNDVSWIRNRPATTVCATDRIAAPGHRDRSPNGESQFSGADTVRITQSEAAILQSFPADYPWEGSKTKQFEQIGNAVPPLLAAHVVSAATGIPIQEWEVAA